MFHHHKLISAIIAIGTVVVVQVFASPFPVFRYLIPAYAAFVIVALAYNYAYLQHLGKYTIWKLIMLALFFLAWFAVFLLLPNFLVRGVFLVGSLPLIYLLEVLIANFGEQIINNQVLLTAFGVFVASWGMQYYYRMSESYIFLAELAALFLLVRGSFAFHPHSEQLKLLSALAMSLFMAQIHWALSFWPLHYSALALISFCLFYAFWTLYHYALFNTLTPKRIQFYLLFALFSIILIVMVTPWKILT